MAGNDPRRRARRGLALIGATMVLLAAAGLSGCRLAPKDLQVTTVLSDIGRPWDIAFSPGGSMFFTERGGKVRMRTTSGEVRTLAEPSDVVAAFEGGMLGIAIDPDFSENR